ncbi:MAG: TIGR04282 family arsenosugar biosynthesis glycosyltransferase [Vicinamibacterales bacterium]
MAILARAPSAGGKARLTADLDASRALRLREALLLDTLAAVTAAGEAVTVFVTPAAYVTEVSSLLGGGVTVQPQCDGDLGARMSRAMETLFVSGATRVVLVGSDLPAIPSSRIADAFAALHEGWDLVLGPAEDGGYYLVGASRPQPSVFEGISWEVRRC